MRGRGSAITTARETFVPPPHVQDRHRGTLPGDVAAIRKLPGVGRYTANAVATFAFNQPVPIVEANSSRVLARLLDMRAPVDSAIGREKLWAFAAQLVPKRNAARFNSALIDLGALVCLADKPKCSVCPVKKFCRAKIPERCPSRNPNRAQSDLSKDTHLSLVTAGSCSSNHPHAGVACGFCRGSKQELLTSRSTGLRFRSPIIGLRLWCTVVQRQTEFLRRSTGLNPSTTSRCHPLIGAQHKPSLAQHQ